MVGVLLGFVVLSAVCAAHRPPYLGFYMDSNATSHTAGANLYLASTPALAVRARASGGMVSLLKVDGAFLQRNPLDPTNRKNMTLRAVLAFAFAYSASFASPSAVLRSRSAWTLSS